LGRPNFTHTFHQIFMAIDREALLSEYNSIFLSKFRVQSILGAGAFGCVYEAECDGYSYAVKKIPVVRSGENRAAKEVEYMKGLSHSNIVEYKDSWFEEPPIGWQNVVNSFIIDELNENDNKTKKKEMNNKLGVKFLYIQMEWISRNKTRTLTRMHRWFKQIASAVAYLHSKEINIIHRDLKPSNILLTNANELKICDMGIATSISRLDGEQEVDKTRTFRTGTPLYWAPEQIMLSCTSKVDIFALGLILAEMCIPMKDKERETVFDSYRDGNANDFTDQPNLNDLIERLTKSNPKDRPECQEIFEHAFIKCFQEKKLFEQAKILTKISAESISSRKSTKNRSASTQGNYDSAGTVVSAFDLTGFTSEFKGRRRRLKSVHDTYLHVNENTRMVDFVEGEPGASETWTILEWGGKVVFKANVSPDAFLRASDDAFVNLAVDVQEREKWRPFKNDNGSWSFCSALDTWLSVRDNGTVTTTLTRSDWEMFRLEAWISSVGPSESVQKTGRCLIQADLTWLGWYLAVDASNSVYLGNRYAESNTCWTIDSLGGELVSLTTDDGRYLSGRPNGEVVLASCYKEDEWWRVIPNENGTYSFENSYGKYLSLKCEPARGTIDCVGHCLRAEKLTIQWLEKTEGGQNGNAQNGNNSPFNSPWRYSLRSWELLHVA
ncbi:hypothetical protein PMAYCL1PPCAC_27013, partial [Pristionchus mayeri]